MHRHNPRFYCSTTFTTQPKPAIQHAHLRPLLLGYGGPTTTLHTSLKAMPAVRGLSINANGIYSL